jgi:hypothetical protein
VRERERVLCRSCGDWGYEDADDPCPGLCPDCFEALLAAQTPVLDAQQRALGSEAALALLLERLRRGGMTEVAVARYGQELRALSGMGEGRPV